MIKRLTGNTLVWATAVVLAVFVLGPLLWLAARAFATTWTYPNLLPDGWTLQWWGTVFEDRSLAVAV